MNYNSTTLDFTALKTRLASNSIMIEYTSSKTIKTVMAEAKPEQCVSGRESFPSAIAARKVSQTHGSPYRDRRFYRCGNCGRYHFSGKEAGPSHPSTCKRNRDNLTLKEMVSLYHTAPREIEML